MVPTTEMPTVQPTTFEPTIPPTAIPTTKPTVTPTTQLPTVIPTIKPTTILPTMEPTVIPTTMEPTMITPTTFPPIPIVVVPEDMVYDPETVESIEETDLTCNDYEGTEFILKGLPKLKSIEIREECFLTTRTFELDGLNALERVVIGRWSFADVNSYEDVENSQRTDGNYTISNCAHLKSIQIDDVSFGDYRFLSLTNLPSLESIVTCIYSFYHAQFALQSGKWDWY